MMEGAAGATALLRSTLAERLGEHSLEWIDEDAGLTGQGIGSLDLIAALARLQRRTGLVLPEDFGIDERTSLAAVAAALRAPEVPPGA
jgi:hypothetical protein